jgi:cell fate (sporulation/competence/biofilm development) regulator YlbF (YheA/YmcA/DUF963 family)
MNIQTVAQNLRNTIAGKEKYLSEIYEQREADKGDDLVSFVTAQMLEVNIGELKRILADVEVCCEKATYNSWKENPDRSGGQFTQDEINNADRWV